MLQDNARSCVATRWRYPFSDSWWALWRCACQWKLCIDNAGSRLHRGDSSNWIHSSRNHRQLSDVCCCWCNVASADSSNSITAHTRDWLFVLKRNSYWKPLYHSWSMDFIYIWYNSAVIVCFCVSVCVCVCLCLCVQVPAVGSRQHRAPFQSQWGHHQNSVSNCGWRQSSRWGQRRRLKSEGWLIFQSRSQVAHRDSFFSIGTWTLEVIVIQERRKCQHMPQLLTCFAWQICFRDSSGKLNRLHEFSSCFKWPNTQYCYISFEGTDTVCCRHHKITQSLMHGHFNRPKVIFKWKDKLFLQ